MEGRINCYTLKLKLIKSYHKELTTSTTKEQLTPD